MAGGVIVTIKIYYESLHRVCSGTPVTQVPRQALSATEKPKSSPSLLCTVSNINCAGSYLKLHVKSCIELLLLE